MFLSLIVILSLSLFILRSLKSEQNLKATHEEDHTTFLQSLFLSSLNISINKQQLN